MTTSLTSAYTIMTMMMVMTMTMMMMMMLSRIVFVRGAFYSVIADHGLSDP